jgi:hypothetical protein
VKSIVNGACRKIVKGGTRKMKRILPFVIFLIVALAGCTHYYTKPGKSTADFNRDKQYCQAVAEQEAARKGTRVCDETESCLIRKGWRSD